MKIKTLHENEWLSLRTVEDPDWDNIPYTYSHEIRCNGEIVGVLPYRWEKDGSLSFMLRSEVTPCWGRDACISSITGGLEEDLTPAETAILELDEEAGLIVTAEELIPLGACRGTKSSDTVYHLFACDVTGKERHEPQGDGSIMEELAHCFWSKNVHDAIDPLVPMMVYRLVYLLENDNPGE